MPRMLVPYDPSWPAQFAAAAAQLAEVGGPEWVIEHIGSTAIPGMRAKPVIDLAVRVPDLTDVDRHRPALEAAGWMRGSGVRSHPVLLRESGGGERTHIAHFFPAADWDTVNQRLLRDWLREHPDDAQRYSRAKCAAVAASARGQSTYNAAKGPAIQEIVDRARRARGLPPVDASDK